MRSNRSIRLGIALMGGAFLLLLVYFVWQFRRPPAQPTTAQTPTSVDGVTSVSMTDGRRAAIALVDLPERSIITPDMFRLEELPAGATDTSYITNPEAQAIGFITQRRILRNERIRTTDLVGHISEVGIAGALAPGMRAMILPLPSKPTFHDLVKIGGYIDVIAAFDQQESRTIVENVRVLAVDVFGNDYPPASVAMRGAYKAPARALRGGNPVASPEQATADGQAPSTPANGQPAPAPTPTPTPAPSAPPAPAITIEVTPEQANRISLAQNSGAVLDYILVPRPTFIAPGATPTDARVATVTRAQLAPYAEAKKSTAPAKSAAPAASGNNGGSSTRARRGGGGLSMVGDSGFSGPPLPEPAPPRPTELAPAGVTVSTPPTRPTYEIPIYADGTKVRTDVVLKPKD